MKKNIKSIVGILIVIAVTIYATINIYQENTKDKTPPPTEVKQTKGQNPSKKEKDNLVTVSIGVQKGNQAPDIELKDMNGQTVKLSDYRGKVVLLNFWASWCPPCRKEMPDLVKFYNNHKEDDFVILGVNMTKLDDREEALAFAKSYNVNYPILMDEYNKYTSIYQVIAFPTSYLIDENGILQEKFVGEMNYEILDAKYQTLKQKD